MLAWASNARMVKDNMDTTLYQAILRRRSVRRYDKSPLDTDTLQRVKDLVGSVKPLTPGNQWQVRYQDDLAREDLSALLGAYGAILTPPHVLVPYLLGEHHPLTDLGYRAERLAVGLTALGLGSCFVGTLSREPQLRERLDLPPGAQIGALLVYGRETTSGVGKGVNRAFRTLVGAAAKLSMDRLCFLETFDQPGAPPEAFLPLVEAGRHAPSADNAQPWRFLWRAGALHVFVNRRNLRYGPEAYQAYRLYDGGICLGNIALALEALGMAGEWQLYAPDAADAPPHPASLEPLARLVLAV
jgi:nitroreductase